jgi:glycosyltransferase involved in cell wall biosynthesis
MMSLTKPEKNNELASAGSPDSITAKVDEKIYLSVVVPISERHDDMKKFFLYYSKELKKIKRDIEFIFIVNDGFERAVNDLKELRNDNREIKIIKLNGNFGEATALSVGFRKARGAYIITLHPYFQVEAEGISNVIRELENGKDLVITRRYPRIDSVLNRVQTFTFHWLIEKLTGMSFRDISCGLRGMKRRVARELNLYGDLHRFIPILAQMQGFRIAEIDVKQNKEESRIRIYRPGVYLRRLLDICTVFFLFKFTKKPLRFFGLIGFSFFTFGFFINLYLSIQRLMGLTGLANRPLLFFGVLIMVLGIQIASIGLLGEIIIFTHARESKDYQIEEILD